MPSFIFSPEKNLKLIQERDISFEEIISAIENEQVIGIEKHPNATKYSHQQLYIIYAKDYVYIVPFINNNDGTIFLKTIIPSRKAKQKYAGKL